MQNNNDTSIDRELITDQSAPTVYNLPIQPLVPFYVRPNGEGQKSRVDLEVLENGLKDVKSRAAEYMPEERKGRSTMVNASHRYRRNH